MVTTLGNAIKRDRLAHAFLLTGVRGVGKTSTARLIAKALNCIGPDGQGGPTIDPCGQCEPCRAIAEGRHIDVIEMDAASHTGIDDVREIIDASRYSAVSARYKIYIIDEVHMLSRQAFNGLLKTLEEPPAHVKFLFATTEVNKVPVTVLSRCQRFDLRRIPAELLAQHFAKVCAAEGVEAETEALALIARAAEGSARDGLSILDQAIAHAGLEGGGVQAEAVRAMLGLSDRGAIRDLFALLLAGDAPGALAGLRGQYDLGVDPQAVLRTLLETVHGVTLAKLGTEPTAGQSAEEMKALERWAAALSFPALHRLWQLLLRDMRKSRAPRCRSRRARWRCCAWSTPRSSPIRASWRSSSRAGRRWRLRRRLPRRRPPSRPSRAISPGSPSYSRPIAASSSPSSFASSCARCAMPRPSCGSSRPSRCRTISSASWARRCARSPGATGS